MNKIKIIFDHYNSIQNKIDKWVEEEKPNIISTSISYHKYEAIISILYSQKLTETELLKS